jgi:predicted nucleic acid-binding protein
MVTLFDTNALIYAFDSASPFHGWAADRLYEALAGSGAAVNPVILAELGVGDHDPATVSLRLEQLGFIFLDLPSAVADRAAEAFGACLLARNKSGVETDRKVPLPDFFIGAHAERLGLPLVSVDTDRYRLYFPEVVLISP